MVQHVMIFQKKGLSNSPEDLKKVCAYAKQTTIRRKLKRMTFLKKKIQIKHSYGYDTANENYKECENDYETKTHKNNN